MKKIIYSLLILVLVSCTSLQEVNTETKKYSSSGYVEVRDSKQYVKIKTEDINKPILLYLHGGPGGAMTPLTNLYFQKLEKEFTVVLWDQRGAGKSYDGKIPDEYQTIDSFVEDANVLTNYLKKKFNKEKIYVIGNSWGSLLGMKLIHKYPENFHAYIGTGQVVDMNENFKVSYDLLLDEAKEKGYKYRESYLEKLGRPEIDGTKGKDKKINKYFKYMTRRTRHSNTTFIEPEFRGIVLMGTVAYNPFIIQFKYLGYKKLWNEIEKVDLKEEITKVEVPVYFALGRQDFHTPYTLAEEYLNILKAPKKELIWFENSAHAPELDESKKFAEVLVRIKNETLSNQFLISNIKLNNFTNSSGNIKVKK